MDDHEKHQVSHVVCVDVFEVMCVIHVLVNNNLFVVCIQDSEKTTPPDTQSDETTTSSDTDALIEALLAVCKEMFSKAEENITEEAEKGI